jgi:hypothetical protein
MNRTSAAASASWYKIDGRARGAGYGRLLPIPATSAFSIGHSLGRQTESVDDRGSASVWSCCTRYQVASPGKQ